MNTDKENQKDNLKVKNTPSQEDWEGGASRPYDEGQKVTPDEEKQVRNFQSIPTQDTHEIDTEEEVENLKERLKRNGEEDKQRRIA